MTEVIHRHLFNANKELTMMMMKEMHDGVKSFCSGVQGPVLASLQQNGDNFVKVAATRWRWMMQDRTDYLARIGKAYVHQWTSFS